MRQVEAEFLILHEWEGWRANNLTPGERASGTDGLAFFVFLQSEKPDLLDFRCRGDKWQIIHAWLLRKGFVCD
ncbi:MAG: hypothetical protein IH878_08320 [Gemmatimonadetes bacterium]|nr:hypothetical protein [Gemmatimonadota bacterium]